MIYEGTKVRILSGPKKGSEGPVLKTQKNKNKSVIVTLEDGTLYVVLVSNVEVIDENR